MFHRKPMTVLELIARLQDLNQPNAIVKVSDAAGTTNHFDVTGAGMDGVLIEPCWCGDAPLESIWIPETVRLVSEFDRPGQG